MKLCCGALLALFFITPAFAQGVPRIKAKIVSVDGSILTVISGAGSNAQTMTVGVTAATRIERQESRALAALKPGDYVGATIVTSGGVNTPRKSISFRKICAARARGCSLWPRARSMIDGTVRQVGRRNAVTGFPGRRGRRRPGLHRPRAQNRWLSWQRRYPGGAGGAGDGAGARRQEPAGAGRHCRAVGDGRPGWPSGDAGTDCARPWAD